jgi:hypothetical protein
MQSGGVSTVTTCTGSGAINLGYRPDRMIIWPLDLVQVRGAYRIQLNKSGGKFAYCKPVETRAQDEPVACYAIARPSGDSSG